MKKLSFLCMGLLIAFGLCSCDGDTNLSFDESLLYGKWQEGSVFERYYDSNIEYVLPDGNTVQVNGITWDEGDDVGEDEAQAFKWTLSGSTLTHEHIGTFTYVPKVYTVTTLTSSSFCYEDAYGLKHQFSKVD